MNYCEINDVKLSMTRIDSCMSLRNRLTIREFGEVRNPFLVILQVSKFRMTCLWNRIHDRAETCMTRMYINRFNCYCSMCSNYSIHLPHKCPDYSLSLFYTYAAITAYPCPIKTQIKAYSWPIQSRIASQQRTNGTIYGSSLVSKQTGHTHYFHI